MLYNDVTTASVEITMGEKHNDLTEIIAHSLSEMKMEQGDKFDLEHVNLAELERRTGISRSRLRRIKTSGVVDHPHALVGKLFLPVFPVSWTILLRKGITNATLCYCRLKESGFQGGLIIVKAHIAGHRDLIPPKRQIIASNRSGGQCYHNRPGESHQMDWEFVAVKDAFCNTYKIACFAMICYCCGQ